MFIDVTCLFIAAVDIKLKEEDIKYLEEPYKPQDMIGHT